MAPIGRLLKRDNPTRCAIHTYGARVFVKMNVSIEPLSHVWIGTPQNPHFFHQEDLQIGTPQNPHLKLYQRIACGVMFKGITRRLANGMKIPRMQT